MGRTLAVAAVLALASCAPSPCDELRCPAPASCVEVASDGAECRCPEGQSLVDGVCVRVGSSGAPCPTCGDGDGDCGSVSRPAPELGVEGLSSHEFPEGCRGEPERLPVEVGVSGFAAAADLDGDAAPDLVVTTSELDLAVLWNDGSARFPTHTVVAHGCWPTDELLVFDAGASAAGVMIARGAGTLDVYGVDAGTRDAVLRSSSMAGEGPIPLAAADLDGEGHADLVVYAEAVEDLVVLLAEHDGTFSESSRRHLRSPAWALPWDADGDGDLDVVTDKIVYFNDGRGEHETWEWGAFARGKPSTVDLDHDGLDDAVWSWEDCRTLSCCGGPTLCDARLAVSLGTESGGLRPLSVRVVMGSAGAAFSVLPVDLDGDRAIDVALWTSTWAEVLPNDGQGNLGVPVVVAGSDGGVGRFRGFAAADFDRDGDADFFLGGEETSEVRLTPCPVRELATIAPPPREGPAPAL